MACFGQQHDEDDEWLRELVTSHRCVSWLQVQTRNHTVCFQNPFAIQKFIFGKVDLPSIPSKDSERHEFPFPNTSQKISLGNETIKPTWNSLCAGKRDLDVCPLPISKKQGAVWMKRLDAYVERFPLLGDMCKTLENKYPQTILFQLPTLDATSGVILRHCSTLLETMFGSQSPVIWLHAQPCMAMGEFPLRL